MAKPFRQPMRVFGGIIEALLESMRPNLSSEGGSGGNPRPPTTRVLFVDDEPAVLDGLRRALRACNVGWDVAFVGGGAEALRLLQARPFDVIVSDLRMPEMDGGTLLEQVRTSYPGVIRIALSGCVEREAALRSAGVVHQYLGKPCEPAKLVECIGRFCDAGVILPNEAARRAVGAIGKLPSLPQTALTLMDLLRRSDVTFAEVNAIIGNDVGMTAKVLQLVNSPLFPVCREITSMTAAVVLLGIDTLKELVFLAEVFSALAPQRTIDGFSFSDFQDHSALTARIAAGLPAPGSVLPAARTAGLLHDIGKLVLAVRLPDQLGRSMALAREQRRPLFAVELEVIGTSHAEVGAYLLGLWGLSPVIVDAVCYHHRPADAEVVGTGLSMAGIIHIADGLAIRLSSRGASLPPDPLDQRYLSDAGIADKLPDWTAEAEKVLPHRPL